MLLFVVRKMLNNKWMVLCLLIGSILVAAMVSSVPMYTDGVLQRMLIKDLEQVQLDSGVYPGTVQVSGNVSYLTPEKRYNAYANTVKRVEEQFIPQLPVPILSRYNQVTVDYTDGYLEGTDTSDPEFKRKYIRLEGLEGYREKIKVTHGRMNEPEPVDGVYEALVTQGFIKRNKVQIGDVYIMRDASKRREGEFKIQIVGVFEAADLSDTFWLPGLNGFKEGVLIDYDVLMRDFVETGDQTLLARSNLYYAMDYHAIRLEHIKQLSELFSSESEYIEKKTVFNISLPALATLKTYVEREQQLKLTLWVLQAPILMMLAFYLFMVSQLIIDYEKNEIAVIKSRGASRSQVLISYLLQSLIISGIALVIGPFLGLQLCTLIGASNGFLEFVQRARLPIELSDRAYGYASVALAFSMLTMLLPAMLSSKATIVEHKRRKSRSQKAKWVKLLLGISLVGMSLYGRYAYNLRQDTLMLAGGDTLKVPVDPTLFLMSTLFILGLGVLMLVVYPYFVQLVFYLGKRFWSPALYASFIQVGRSGGQEQFLMLFLVLTLSVGIFSANSARTINLNTEEKIMYANGCDMVLTSEWSNNAPTSSPMSGGAAEESYSSEAVLYKEPDYLKYQTLPGAERTARVYVNDKAIVTASGTTESTESTYMAFHPYEFGEVVWSRSDLNDHPMNTYLNLLTQAPNAVLLSRSFQTEKNIKAGDVLYITWSRQQMAVQVAGFVDFWPSINPYKPMRLTKVTKDDETERVSAKNAEPPKANFFIIGNMRYLNAKMAIEPYQVWMKLAEDASVDELYREIEARKLRVVEVKDSRQELVRQKNDPMLQGLNGAMTMGFVVTMTISAIGFIIYWVLSIKGRVLQFGILRAMGLRMRSIIAMLGMEQLLISFVSILAGVVIGGITCDLFVPMLEMAFSVADQVPRFRVVANAEDYQRIYTIVLGMLLIGFTALGVLISRIKMSQAIKLGED